MLSDSQIERYSRQIILPQVGGKGQEKLLRARVLVNGNGPLQTAALFYLAAAGVGTIGVIASDSSAVLSAFAPDQRDPASAALTRLNPDCTVVIHQAMDLPGPEQIVQGYDLVLSPPGPLHETCYTLRRPFLCAQVSAAGAWLFPCLGYEPGHACMHCLPPHLFEGGANAPALAALFLGTLQATEAIKFILGLHSSLDKLLSCQFPALHFSECIVRKDPQCPCCGSPAA
ncbi:MAG TPA: ThiF family adenylyltransferase [Candidatus Binatia bacterium]|jgi:adenylyltransferase/sulfurtransferase|nr:ThiF family adenylyltransferase [Candidatus Binatia bacterium]